MPMSSRLLLALFLVLLLSGCSTFPPTPPPPASVTVVPVTPTLPALAAPLRIEEGGVAVSPPSGWASQVLSTSLTLAPSEAALKPASPGADLVLSIDTTPLANLVAQLGSEATRDPAAFFELSSGAAQSAGYTISPTRVITVAGWPGLSADLATPGGAGRLAVILTDVGAVRVLGQAAPTAWANQAAIYEAVLNSLSFFSTAKPTPTPVNLAGQPLLVDDGPADFALRIGGSAGPADGRFVATRGLAVAPDGTLYIAESRRGIWVFAPDGTLIGTFGSNELLDAYDVARAPDGTLFVADFGRNAIARFRPDGSFIERWGSPGDQPGQFGLTSPQRIALGADSSVYALDSRPGPESGRIVSSILHFSADGKPLTRIELAPELSPADLAVDERGTIYLADTFGGVIKLDAKGNELARFSDPADPQALAAAAIDRDRQGNLFLATYTEGLVRLAPNGQVVARGGGVATPGSIPAPGELSQPNGVAAAPGGIVWVSDNSGEYSAVTALRLRVDEAAIATALAQVTPEPNNTTVPTPQADLLLRQWANQARASSFYAPDYDPAGAIGPPDVENCQDSPLAWASGDPNGLEWLELRYARPVFAVGLEIYQNAGPGMVSKVELIDERGQAVTVYSATATASGECPLAQTIEFEQSLTRTAAVRITLDQRSGAAWGEIDAVELIGVP